MQTVEVNIDQLLLDPNNYRLHSHPRYTEVEEKDIANKMVQKRTHTMIEGENREGIKDLIDSFKTNGFLRIDNILVRQYHSPKPQHSPAPLYVVIEGNRRVATLKALKEDMEKGFSIGNVDERLFHSIEVVVYEVDDEAYTLLMGLRHVSGIKEWGDYEQSELIMNLKQKYGMDTNEIAHRLGMTKQAVKKRLDSFIAMEKFRADEEYGEYFTPALSGIFYELMGKKDLKEWLGWDSELNDFTEKARLKRFFGWLSPGEEDDETGVKRPPIIQRRDELRILNKFIKDEQALDIMEETGSIYEALEQSAYYTQEGFKNNLATIKKSLDKITMTALLDMDKQTEKEVTAIINTIDKLIAGMKRVMRTE
ncbi:ParB N-terminal domain-containing protein [Aneurinibacillus danicus]|jgi:hypothetical protein|uniref:Uncharacterized protein n=1 Tax=Aneurinibacillus danicus TaxID=267746 RepID=A0A511VB49_9BACL|nr:ParB N-terminal domain-containing protein [Aneurinibacillus danicus]GEN35138.1 hypothetical protein ADA01nite_25980 [Aneurinibacillus danicus]